MRRKLDELATHQKRTSCRLRLDLSELRRKNGGFFGSGDKTGCYDEETEVLTQNRGWILFKDLTKNDILFTRNHNGEIEYHKPTKLFKYKYNDIMYHFKNSRFDMKVTPNHRFLYEDKHTFKSGFVRADEYSRTKHPIPKKAVNNNKDANYFILPPIESHFITGEYGGLHIRKWKPLQISMKAWLQFLGLFISEGSTINEKSAKRYGYSVCISQVNKENYPYIRKVLDQMPFNYLKLGHNFTIWNKQLWTYLRENVGTNCYTKRIPREILNTCSSEELKYLYEALIIGDGSVHINTGETTYYTSSKELAGNFQELCLLTGFACGNIRTRQPRNSIIRGRLICKENCHEQYEITVSKSDYFYINSKDILKEQYNGYVYCCEVPNHVLMVRRNGKATWCGNSITVVTLNMPRLAYKSNNIIEFYNSLDKLMDIAAKTIEQRREFCTKMMNDGLYPYTKRYLGNFDNHFSTIGLVGMNEACLNAKWIKNNLTDKKAQAFTKAVLNHMRDRLIIYQEEYGHLFNLEATPAESTAYRFAKKDKEMYPDIITASDETPYYTNSSHLPVGATDDIFDALDIQDELQTLYTSGTVFHAFLGEKLPDWKSAMDLVRKIASNYKLPYFTLSPTFSICKNHGYIQGEEYTCPSCHEKTEVYSRITGYYRPVQNWNNGKAQEFKDRKEYKIDKSNNSNNNVQDMVYHSDDTPDDVEILTEPVTEEIIYESEHAPNTSSNILFDGPGLYLFTTPTCPKCKFVKQKFAEKNIHYFLQDVTDKECEERAVKLDIKAAPTLVSVDAEGNITVYSTVNEIINYINT